MSPHSLIAPGPLWINNRHSKFKGCKVFNPSHPAPPTSHPRTSHHMHIYNIKHLNTPHAARWLFLQCTDVFPALILILHPKSATGHDILVSVFLGQSSVGLSAGLSNTCYSMIIIDVLPYPPSPSPPLFFFFSSFFSFKM